MLYISLVLAHNILNLSLVEKIFLDSLHISSGFLPVSAILPQNNEIIVSVAGFRNLLKFLHCSVVNIAVIFNFIPLSESTFIKSPENSPCYPVPRPQCPTIQGV